jgi:hypothetical protein
MQNTENQSVENENGQNEEAGAGAGLKEAEIFGSVKGEALAVLEEVADCPAVPAKPVDPGESVSEKPDAPVFKTAWAKIKSERYF